MARPRAEAAEKPKNETTYVVLLGNHGNTDLVIVGDVIANGPEQAVRRAAGDREGVFIAIPARNWTIVEQESETPPPVISQKISKWADGPPSIGDEPVPDGVLPIPAELPPRGPGITSKPDDESDAVSDAAEVLVAAPHPADAIEEDGA